MMDSVEKAKQLAGLIDAKSREDRAKFKFFDEERDAAQAVVAHLVANGRYPADPEKFRKWVVEWALNGVEFYREEKLTGRKSYIVTNGPAPEAETGWRSDGLVSDA